MKSMACVNPECSGEVEGTDMPSDVVHYKCTLCGSSWTMPDDEGPPRDVTIKAEPS